VATVDSRVRPELLEASDETIEDAVCYAEPMVLRGLLYQLTGDETVAATEVRTVQRGFGEVTAVATDDDIALLRRKAADFLKEYRDAGAGEISVGPDERLHKSLELAAGLEFTDEHMGLCMEEVALNPWARSLEWSATPDRKRLEDFRVLVIGAGMGGLNAALQLKRAGIPYTVFEKNSDVGGTWYENRYPGARVDTLSRAYTNIFGVDFEYPNPFCPWTENERYFRWIADTFELRDDIAFDTEVRAATWDEDTSEWVVVADGPEGESTLRVNAIITAVGFLNRPNIPEFEGMLEFSGPSWHSARWPEGFDIKGKRFAVIGTGCSGYQMIPELALEAEHVTVFQRTAQWLMGTNGYRSPFPPQVNWLDRNLPFHTNFMRFRASLAIRMFAILSEIDPEFDDPKAVNPTNKRIHDACMAFLEDKLGDPELVAKMTPPHPVLSARPVNCDPEYSVLDAIQRDNVTLVTAPIRRVTATGVRDVDGNHHEVDVIVYATGFHATDFLFPMTITGRDGQTLDEMWADGGARAYRGTMVPGFPNMWMIYGPNTNAGLYPSSYEELEVLYALQCMERLILGAEREVEPTEEAYWRFNELVDARNARKAWSDPRANNYYWTNHGRSAVMCPFDPWEVWHLMRRPKFDELAFR
jgi:4-hydroxyacetophenone monooxygenase